MSCERPRTGEQVRLKAQCRRRDSNSHCPGPKPGLSANWSTPAGTPTVPPLPFGPMTPDPSLLREIAQTGGFGDPQNDVFNRLLRNRIVFLGTEVDDAIANLITAQLLYLEG